MTGSDESGSGMPSRLAVLLTEVAAEAISAARGTVAGVYLPSDVPAVLRLGVLAGLPGPLFRPWWRVHVERQFPVADAFRSGVQVTLPNATETMRRYPQFAAALPFPVGSITVPVTTGRTPSGVLTVLRPAATDVTEMLPERDRLVALAAGLALRLDGLEKAGSRAVWEDEPLCLRPPSARLGTARVGRFTWDPAADLVTADDGARTLLDLAPDDLPGPAGTLARAVDRGDALRLMALLRETARGRTPLRPLPVRVAQGALRLVDLRPASGARLVAGVVLEADPVADTAAELLPQGVFCLDRLGITVYANPRAAHLLGAARDRLVGRPLWEAVPWLQQPVCEDHLRAALLAPEAVHFHVRRPPGPHPYEGDWLALSVRPGPDVLTCTVVPANRMADAPAPPPAASRLPTHAPGPVPAVEPHPGSAVRGAEPGPAATAPGSEAHPGPTTPGTEAHPGPAAHAAAASPVHGTEAPTAVPAAGPAGTADGPHSPADALRSASFYRPITLAIALTEAATARQVSAVVMQELLPAFGSRRLAIYLLQDRHLYLAWETGFPEGFLKPFDGVSLDTRLPGVETLTTGQPLFFDSMQQLAAAYPGIALDAPEGARAFLPLIASGRPVGSCILGFDGPRSFSQEERSVLTALAGLIAHALEKAQRYDTEAALARGLQRALLPRRLSVHPRLETAGRYLPGTEGMDVGGDWYDVVEAGDGVALVIGDVQGHGVQAAATMGQLRSAVRAFALDDRPPEQVLSGTNRLLIDLDPGQFASCCYVWLDPATGVARIARAGHPPPLLRHPDGRTEVVETPVGVVLGVVTHARYPVTEIRMEPGAILALYTDGLVERQGVDIDDGIGALRVALARAGAVSVRPDARALTSVADRLTATMRHTADRPDDIALLLAARRGGEGGPG
ncbi:SpoIIE family protein phosphatase [Streptomyces sp. NPDC053367]|uniref:SpoIIE family protein phosphatase n=1 Tax=Streptomyces sp. NPDC053367 TaxID=3365700 RepID=UPI0037D2B0FC